MTTRKPPARAKPAARTARKVATPAAKRVAGKPAKAARASKAASKPASKPAAKAPARKPAPRGDLGAPIAGFFARQPATMRPIALALRTLIELEAPDARSSLKWGMPWFAIGDAPYCAIGGHKSHVNLILPGPPGTYADPRGLLSGDGKTGRHLKLTTLVGLPEAEIRAWLKIAAARARADA